MYRFSFILVMMLFLAGCSDDADYSFKEEVYAVEDIQFESDFWGAGNNIFVDTEEMTIVSPRRSLKFIKQEGETTLKITTRFYKEEKSTVQPEKHTIYINEKDLKKISKKYADVFHETINVVEE